MRRFRSNRRRAKRSVSWIAGISTYDSVAPLDYRTVPLTPIAAGSTVWGASIGLVIPSDLPIHGGEDAVLTRVVGRLGFMQGLVNLSGGGNAATGFQMRVVVAVTDYLPGGTVTPWDFTSSAGLGNDDIMFMRDVWVPSVAIGAVGAGVDAIGGGYESWLELDVKAKRKLQEDRMVVLWFQTVQAATATAQSFALLGGTRALLMRPR